LYVLFGGEPGGKTRENLGWERGGDLRSSSPRMGRPLIGIISLGKRGDEIHESFGKGRGAIPRLSGADKGILIP